MRKVLVVLTKVVVYVMTVVLLAALAIPGFVFGLGVAVAFWLGVGFFGQLRAMRQAGTF